MSHLSLATDWYACNVIGSILFGAIKRNQSHTKSTNEIHHHKACVYYFFVNKDGDNWDKPCARTILSFFSMQPMKN